MGMSAFELIRDVRGAFQLEAFRARYLDYLDKYDYIVGDWGYGQLRLKGFYAENRKSAPPDQRIDALDQYIQEYCNFGCKYFVVRRLSEHAGHTARRSKDAAEVQIEPSDSDKKQK
ncbi:MAG: YutD family protein [Candidatus Carbobacillus altaicus]|nr:YutD family protein [Candidatus Carbobacillus altaicus]